MPASAPGRLTPDGRIQPVAGVNGQSAPYREAADGSRRTRKKSLIDDIDRGIVHALRIDGRVPFNRIASALGVSAQTVARRYARLRTDASLRVVGLVNPDRAGEARWLLRLSTSPGAAQDIALSLAQRTDTSWVRLASGGTEIFAIIHTTPDNASHHPLLLRDIPRSHSVTAVSAHHLLHTYLGGPVAWHGHTAVLNGEQQQQLALHAGGNGKSYQADRTVIKDTDSELLQALQSDGRAALADLAAVTGWSQATVARRISALQGSSAVFFDIEIDDAVFGITTQALLWASVPPAHLEEVAVTLAKHEELAFVAATTGPTNLVAHILCTDPAELHYYLTHRLGPLDAIRSLETAPVLQTVKAASPILPARRRPRVGPLGAVLPGAL
jgi:DNA-binding Lrp family transcriptional regulator